MLSGGTQSGFIAAGALASTFLGYFIFASAVGTASFLKR